MFTTEADITDAENCILPSAAVCGNRLAVSAPGTSRWGSTESSAISSQGTDNGPTTVVNGTSRDTIRPRSVSPACRVEAKAHQRAWAKHLGQPVQVKNSIGMEFQLIPPGKFTMGRFAPNAWGLHDMHGNVWEWCADWYGEYPRGEASDPTGPASGDRRVFRGGCWINFPAVCRSANRAKVAPVSWNFHLGFRVVRVLD